MESSLAQSLDDAVAAVRKTYAGRPELAVILGSGLGDLAEEVRPEPRPIPYGEIPHFSISTVPGHAGRLVPGKLEGRDVVMFQGRVHAYEGHALDRLVFPIRVAARLGAKILIVTNSAGGASKEYRPGDLMLIEDHVNLLGSSPLRGPNDDSLGPRFPDMSRAYDPELLAQAHAVGRELGVPLKQGVYLATHGPNYETPAEIRMMRTLGADAVGMSTVPEVIAARHMGLRVLGISCITNMAAGMSPTPLSHEEVIETTRRVQQRFMRLLRALVGRLGR